MEIILIILLLFLIVATYPKWSYKQHYLRHKNLSENNREIKNEKI